MRSDSTGNWNHGFPMVIWHKNVTSNFEIIFVNIALYKSIADSYKQMKISRRQRKFLGTFIGMKPFLL